MAVIAVLVAVAIPTFGSQLEKARQATDRANLRDAYASAKLAIQTADETTGTVKSALATGGVDGSTTHPYETGIYTFWYNADGANEGWTYAGKRQGSDTIAVSTADASRALLMKATTATDLDPNALPGSVSYAAKPSDVTAPAGVLVQIAYNKYANDWSLAGIGFSVDGATLIGGLKVNKVINEITVTKDAATTGHTALEATPYGATTKLDFGTGAGKCTISADAANTAALASVGLKIENGAWPTTLDNVTTVPSNKVDIVLTLKDNDTGRVATAILQQK